MEVTRQTRPDGFRKMAEQQDSATAHADLEQSGTSALDPDDIVTHCRGHSPARSGQLRIETDMQEGSGALFHASLMRP